MKRVTIASLAITLSTAALSQGANYPVSNNGFEVNNLGSGGAAYEYGTVPSWTIIGNPGEAANGSGFGVNGATNGNADATTSTVGQAALFQGGNGTLADIVVSPTVTTHAVAITQDIMAGPGDFTINFSTEERGCCGGNNAQLVVFLDGVAVKTVTPASTSVFTDDHTPTVFFATAGTHTIGFAGLGGTGDTTVFVDNVSATPEPASIALLGMTSLGLLARRRRA